MVGIAVFGSVARGDCGPDSDIELLVVDRAVQGPETRLFRRERVTVHEQVVPEIDLDAPRRERWRMRPPLADGWIVLDRDGRLGRLKEICQEIAEAGRLALEEAEIEALHRSLSERAREVERHLGQPETALLLYHEALGKVLQAFYGQRRLWYPGTKRLLAELASVDPEFHSLVLGFLRGGPGGAANALQAMDYVLRGWGGRWEPPEEDGGRGGGTRPSVLVLMGVAGCGKTTVGRMLAARLGWEFVDGDDYHAAASVAKMRSGVPLSDDDRLPWLGALRREVTARRELGHRVVLACSALRRSYREVLASGDPGVRFVYLKGSVAVIAARLAARKGHYFPPTLLQSQFEAFEEPGPAEAITVLVDGNPGEVVERIICQLKAAGGS